MDRIPVFMAAWSKFAVSLQLFMIVVVSSKFGWLLSGLIPTISTNPLSHTHVIITAGVNSTTYDKNSELLTSLQKFWETESIGVVENFSTTCDKNEFFLPLIHFDGLRYEVGLPWMVHHPNILDHRALCQRRLNSLCK